jgi:hypothetical protein
MPERTAAKAVQDCELKSRRGNFLGGFLAYEYTHPYLICVICPKLKITITLQN